MFDSPLSLIVYNYLLSYSDVPKSVALAEWLRRVPAKYMGFPRESSNLSGDGIFHYLFY